MLRPLHLRALAAGANCPVADQVQHVAAEVVVVRAESDRRKLDAVGHR